MTERPIIFSAPMIRALLADGSKTQTRRLVQPQPHAGVRQSPFVPSGLEDGHGREIRMRYGAPGDRLWVREQWGHDAESLEQCRAAHEDVMGSGAYGPYYKATECAPDTLRWRSPIHMPRWASRITLELTGVRIERLHDISEADAITEGLNGLSKDWGITIKYGVSDMDGLPGNDDDGWHWSQWHTDPRVAYRKLWEAINGSGSWADNPFVWVLDCRRI